MRKVQGLLAAVLVIVVVTGCRKQPPAVPEPTQTPTTVPQTQPQTSTPTVTPVSNNDEANRLEELRRLTAILEQIVHFDYDESTIRTDAQELLAAKVPVLRANPTIRIRIEGHADERGSVEYNLALGMRRANAVRDYLADFGIDPARFDIVSFGEDRPLSTGTSESSWSQNRRAEFRVTAGMGR
ncbi:MAG TPA: peptidoglycan-associated lipoprotein Pal [Longimicrobiales bacterium]|nr:peptidoglycan-associated lipoprotein Pal [Longimicrobiales bacterium]